MGSGTSARSRGAGVVRVQVRGTGGRMDDTSVTGSRREAAGEGIIHTRALTKRYRGGQLAVDGLDLTVPAGSVFGFLGPNGSGKPRPAVPGCCSPST